MNRGLKIVAIVIAVLIVIVIVTPLFIDANSFRPKIESELTDALGRQVKVGNISLSLFSGGVTADNISIADDPAFNKSDFVTAKSLKVGVEMLPLIFSKTLDITDITLTQPEISLVRSENGDKWNFSSLGTKTSGQAPTAPPPAASASAKPAPTQEPAPSGSAPANPNLSIAKLNVDDGRLSVSQAGSSEPARVYDKLNIQVTGFSFNSSFPFHLSANLPGGGTLKLDGNAGPINAGNAELTPLQAKVSVNQMNLAQSGFIDPATGIAGIADFDGNVTSDGQEAKTTGTLNADKLQLVKKNGSPAGRPVALQYEATYNLKTEAGNINQGQVKLGSAVANLNGTYDAHGKVTTVNMKLTGQGMPVNDLEAMLPAVGVVLPSGSQLKSGILDINFNITGPVDKLVTVGNLKMQNAALTGFNLGSKLTSIPALNGKSVGNDTVIQNLSADVRVSPDGTKIDNLNLTVPSLGSVTGAGTVSPSNQLDFKLKADNVPLLVSGTTSDPKFAPDFKGLAGSLLNQKNLGKNPLSGVSGLFNKKK
jgi:AsmA protein